MMSIAGQYVLAATASPVPMSFAELYNNIQQGIVDGGDNSDIGYFIGSFDEVAPYLTLSNYAINPTRLLCSKAFFDSLEPDLQEAMLEAGKYAAQVSMDVYDKTFDKCVREAKDKVDIHVPDNIDEFIAAGRGIWDELLSDIPQGEELMAIYEEVIADIRK